MDADSMAHAITIPVACLNLFFIAYSFSLFALEQPFPTSDCLMPASVPPLTGIPSPEATCQF
jgi:hypothetical protein